jgi:hypothetical protein
MRRIDKNKIVFSWENSEVHELSEPVSLSIYTRCPEKYVLIDTETGQVYRATNDVNTFVPSQLLWKEVK